MTHCLVSSPLSEQKLAGKAPDRKHSYGYGRIEYMTAFIVSAIVLYADATALVESVKKIITPESPDYAPTTLIVLTAGIIIDFAIPNREELYQHIYDEVQSKYKDYALNITLDLDAND